MPAKCHSAIDAKLGREIDTSIRPEPVPRLVYRLPGEIKLVIGITNRGTEKVLAKCHSAIDAKLGREIDTSIRSEPVPRLLFRLPCQNESVIWITTPSKGESREKDELYEGPTENNVEQGHEID